MPPKAWLEPPRSLLILLFLVAFVSISAVAWFGWKLLDLERMLEAQRGQERLEQDADQITATLRGLVAETGDRLSAWVDNPPPDKPDDGILLLITDRSMTVRPNGRLLYHPFPTVDPEASSGVFTEAESFEFVEAQAHKAAEIYRRLAESEDPAIRAGALMRLGRALRATGSRDEAVAAYVRLAAVSGATCAGVPAQLVGRHALAELSGRDQDAAELTKGLLAGRWHLTRGQFDFYWSESGRIGHNSGPRPPADGVALAAAASMIWDKRAELLTPRGQRTVWVEDQPFLIMWRGAAARWAVLLIRPPSLLTPAVSARNVIAAAVDSEGRVVAGGRDSTARAAVRTSSENQLPWTLYLTGRRAAGQSTVFARERLLLLGMAVMVFFLAAGTYFIGRAIRRETEVSRLQADFVSAVSHEFRSPLTSMRQLSEILALGRVPSEERKQIYYDTLVKETGRLQRLVETLLNFGRMEAGGRRYHFEAVDPSSLVERVVAEFEPQIAGSGRAIDAHGPAGELQINADSEALSVALRNLLDNALKYSPDQPVVWVEWGAVNHHVAIRVRDQGPGITAAERKTIFQKFVRGTAAETGNVKGTGVGLAMVQRIVEAHGGDVTVASEPGSGSTFTLLLPRVEGRESR